MKPELRLFKAVKIQKLETRKLNKDLIELCIKGGFILSPEISGNYTDSQLREIILDIKKLYSLTGDQMNSSFHKSWNKIKTADIEQLYIEQALHYLTTYGYDSLGIYKDETIFIPNEELNIPNLEEKVCFAVIKGYTEQELKEKLLSLLNSGIALKDQAVKDSVELALSVEFCAKDLELIKNKEVKCEMYSNLQMMPKNAIEFLRFVVYKSTGSALLIKSPEIITQIKENHLQSISSLFFEYSNHMSGAEELSKIFLRFKPLFLAFKGDNVVNPVINRVRRLAKKHHKPMPVDYLNNVTSILSKGLNLNLEDLKGELEKVNTFRKIRLAYALKYKMQDPVSILYKIRNGKGFAEGISNKLTGNVVEVFNVVYDSIKKDIEKKVKGKSIYIPDNIIYALPSSQKQFTGVFPLGTCVSLDKDMIVGIYWENGDYGSIDLDLAILNEAGKMGWDGSYRSNENGNGNILFSGDITSAPNGATELFYVQSQELSANLLTLNYYNYNQEKPVPFKIMVAHEHIESFNKDYLINPNNVIAVSNSILDKKEKILGMLITSKEGNKFYFAETYIGGNISSSDSDYMKHSRRYLFDFYRNSISLNDILKEIKCDMVDRPRDADIDLSPNKLELDTILNLLS